MPSKPAAFQDNEFLAWSDAGFVGLTSQALVGGDRFSAAHLGVPAATEVNRSGTAVLWRWDTDDRSAVEVDSPPDLLDSFLQLASGEPDACRKFVASFGPLVLCEVHGLPATHSPSACKPAARRGWFVEPVGGLQGWARRASDLLSIAASLLGSDPAPADPSLWQSLYGEIPPWAWSDARERKVDLDVQVVGERRRTAEVLTAWLQIGGVVVTAEWPPGSDEPTPRVGGSGTFAAIAVQLLLTTCRSEGLVFCAECKRPYAPTRRVRADRENFCRQCGKTAANRRARTRYRNKNRKAARGDEH